MLMRQRDALRPLFRSTWDNLAARFETSELEGWASGVLALADVNAGPSCLVAFWEISRNQPTEEGIAPLMAAAHTSANICRHAGAQATAAAIVAIAAARRVLGSAHLARWSRGRGGGVADGRNPVGGQYPVLREFCRRRLETDRQRQAQTAFLLHAAGRTGATAGRERR
jgi:hypothetical protein